jgi:hypothetical protein
MSLAQAIERNRIRQFRFKRAERIMRQVRLNIFDYEDAGKLAKAHRVIERCKQVLEPLWAQQRKNAENRKLQNYMM